MLCCQLGIRQAGSGRGQARSCEGGLAMNRETATALARSLLGHLDWHRETALFVADGDPAFADWLASQRLRREISDHPEFLVLFEAWGIRPGAFRGPGPARP